MHGGECECAFSAFMRPDGNAGHADSPATIENVVASASIAPSLLVAMPQLLDPNFHRTVVLLVHHDATGSFGVVLNRTTEIRAERLCGEHRHPVARRSRRGDLLG